MRQTASTISDAASNAAACGSGAAALVGRVDLMMGAARPAWHPWNARDQVWTGNEWWWYSNGYATDGSGFLSYPGNAGNSSSGWVRTGPPWATEADEDAQPAIWLASAAAASLVIGSSLS